MGGPGELVADFSPGKGFPSVSVTGRKCGQMCAHCMGRHLCGMAPSEDPETLLEVAERVLRTGGEGMLLSGGSGKDGRVPLAPFASAIRRISNSGLLINAHPGVIGPKDASLLVSSGVSRFSVDVHQDPYVIGSVFNLPGPEVYEGTIDAILGAGGVPVPHLTAGLGDRDIAGSAELLVKKGIMHAVLLALVPTRGTPFENRGASEGDVTEAVGILSDMGISVTLGCMRDRSMRGLEMKCVEMGVRAIANMSRDTEGHLVSEGFRVKSFRRCCCFGSE